MTDDSDLAAEARELVERIVDGIGVNAQIDLDEDDETITVVCTGPDLGMLIGRHGQTIDAIQYLANAAMYRGHADDRKEVVVDAAGYRARRRASLEALAVRSAERCVADRGAGRARADDRGRAEGRPHPPEGVRRRRDDERGNRAEPVRRDPSARLLSATSGPGGGSGRFQRSVLDDWLRAVVATPA